MRAAGSTEYAGAEPHYLLTAKSLVDDGDVDLTDDYRARGYSEFYPGTLRPEGLLTRGRLDEPQGVGFPLLIAPAFGIAGAKCAYGFLAAVAALAVLPG